MEERTLLDESLELEDILMRQEDSTDAVPEGPISQELLARVLSEVSDDEIDTERYKSMTIESGDLLGTSDDDFGDMEGRFVNDEVYVSPKARLEAAAAAEADEEEEEQRKRRNEREERLKEVREEARKANERAADRAAEREAADAVISSATLMPQSAAIRALRPQKLAVVDFPLRLEQLTRSADDWIIARVQATNHVALRTLALVITAASAIEIAFAVPFILFALGIDGLATEAMYMAAVTGLLSQVPKRFLWRWRPWMLGRADTRKRTTTSSFPSRAVACSVVYSFCVCYAAWSYGFGNTLYLAWLWMPALIVFSGLLSSWARVYLGVHYPSDCLVGALLGVAICGAGLLLLLADVLGCTSCREGECYADLTAPNRITPVNMSAVGWWPLILSAAAAVLATILFMMPPVQFWEKCERAFGLLAPCFVFQLAFLCPNGSTSGGSLAAPLLPPVWWSYPFALFAPALAVGAIHLAGSKVPFLVFLLAFSILFLALSLWRLMLLPVT